MNPQIDLDAALNAAISALAQANANHFMSVGRIAALEKQLAELQATSAPATGGEPPAEQAAAKPKG